MELVNEMYSYAESHSSIAEGFKKEIVRSLLILLAPFVPHITEELWRKLGAEESSVHDAEWVVVDSSALTVDEVELAIQVNGRVRTVMSVPIAMEKEEIEYKAKTLSAIQKFIEGKTIVKVIVVPKKIVNIVVK